jgi:colanic acid/amylovoran biosynthesis glycosyltransferase
VITQEPRLLYILRTFPELSETFVLREIQALRGAGVPVSVLAIGPGAYAAMVEPEGAPGEELPPFRYLSHSAGRLDRWRDDHGNGSGMSTVVRPDGPVTRGSGGGPSSERAEAGKRVRSLLGELARDLASLGGHPRRTARALRLAAYARRARALVPPGTVRIHAHFANDAAALARYVSALTRLPYRVTAHAYDIYQDPFLVGPNLAGAERVYTVARANLDALLARAPAEGWDRARFALLRCGIDLSVFAYRDPTPVGRPARLLTVARLVPKKGLTTLLDAVARSADVTLTIAGDGPLAAEIAARAAAPDLRDRVMLLGAIPSTRVRGLMRDADLFVLASRIAEDGDRDGLPVSLVEAMALGLPVLATAVAGIPELVTEKTGRLVPAGGGDSAGALAAALDRALAETPERRVDLARAARRRVEAEFDLKLQVAALRP